MDNLTVYDLTSYRELQQYAAALNARVCCRRQWRGVKPNFDVASRNVGVVVPFFFLGRNNASNHETAPVTPGFGSLAALNDHCRHHLMGH